MSTCPDCGAPIAPGETCRAMFEVLLAHEYQFPEAFGAVHHLTVAAYQLQHPRGFSHDAIDGWQRLIADALDGVATPNDFLRRARYRFSGAARVREDGAEPPADWPRRWPVTVADVVVPPGAPIDAAGHIDRVTHWAASIRATLATT